MRRRVPALAAAIGAVAITVVVALALDDPPARMAPARSLPPLATGAAVRVGGTPVAVAAGGGAVWVVDGTGSRLVRVDERTGEVGEQPQRVPGGPFAVAVGEGGVWVASGDGTVRSFDLATGRPTGRVARVAGANGLATGAGAVWVTSRIAGTVTRVDPATGRAGLAVRVASGAADVAVGAGGVWVAGADDGTVTRVDPATGRPDRPIAVGGAQVRALAVGGDALWVARAGGELTDEVGVVRIDVEEGRPDGPGVRVPGGVPVDLAADRAQVFASAPGGPRVEAQADPGGVTRIDAAGGAVAGPALRAGDGPVALALGRTALWVVAADGTLTPVAAAR